MKIKNKIFQILIFFVVGVLLISSAPISAHAEDESGISSLQTIIAKAQIIAQEQKKDEDYNNKLNQVREIALAQLGIPYVWGGTSRAGFDCSGFVQYVYRQCGISIPRTTYSQIYCGESVSIDSLTLGDIIFWGNHHVGLYIGEGQYIDALQTGDVIRVRQIENRPPTSARRLIFRE